MASIKNVLSLVRNPDFSAKEEENNDNFYHYWGVDYNERGIALSGISLRSDGRVYFYYKTLAKNIEEALNLFSNKEFRHKYHLNIDPFKELKSLVDQERLESF